MFQEQKKGMVPYLQPSGQAMLCLKMWFHSDLLAQGYKSLTALRCSFCCFCFPPTSALFFAIDNTTKLGMKDFLKAQQLLTEIRT